MRSLATSTATPPGTMQSIISRCPKQALATRSTCSRRMLQWAWISEKEASLQMAPMSPRWLARRSSSAIRARSQMARWGGALPCAASTASAKANE
jgi:hypothetical protein